MAIFATRRRWEVTSLWAASISWLSRQRWASDSSSSGVSIGNLRISWRYRERLPSGAIFRTAEATNFGSLFIRLKGLPWPAAQVCGLKVTEPSLDAGRELHVPAIRPDHWQRYCRTSRLRRASARAD